MSSGQIAGAVAAAALALATLLSHASCQAAPSPTSGQVAVQPVATQSTQPMGSGAAASVRMTPTSDDKAEGTGDPTPAGDPTLAGNPTPTTDAPDDSRTVPEVTSPKGVPVSQSLPWVDMDASLIDATWLGAHDELGEAATDSWREGATPYYWDAQNGTGDHVYVAFVRDGRLVSMERLNIDKNYWAVENSLEQRDLPNRMASGDVVPAPKTESELPDPLDYDDPDEYAEDAMAYFEELGEPKAYEAAVDYWEDNV